MIFHRRLLWRFIIVCAALGGLARVSRYSFFYKIFFRFFDFLKLERFVFVRFVLICKMKYNRNNDSKKIDDESGDEATLASSMESAYSYG